MSFEVQVDAMRADSTKWTGWSDALSSAQTGMYPGGSSSVQFGALANFVDLGPAFETLHDMIVGLLRDGTTCFDTTATALLEVAQTYEDSDRESSDRFRA